MNELCWPVARAVCLNPSFVSPERDVARLKNRNAKNRAAWINGGPSLSPSLSLSPCSSARTRSRRRGKDGPAKRGREARIKVLPEARQSPPRVKVKRARRATDGGEGDVRTQHKDSVTSHLHSTDSRAHTDNTQAGHMHAQRRNQNVTKARNATSIHTRRENAAKKEVIGGNLFKGCLFGVEKAVRE